MDCKAITMYRNLEIQAIRQHNAKSMAKESFKSIKHETFGIDKSFFMTKLGLKVESTDDKSGNKDFDIYI